MPYGVVGPVMAATKIWFGSVLRSLRNLTSSGMRVSRSVGLAPAGQGPSSFDTQPVSPSMGPRGGGASCPFCIQRWPNSLQRNDQSGPSGSLISSCDESTSVESSGTEQSSSLVTRMTAR